MKKIIFGLYLSVILSTPVYSSEKGNFILELIFDSIEKKVNNLFNEEPFAVSKKKVKIHPDKTYVEVKGIIKNRGSQARYVKVSVPCYDKKGEKLGNAFELIEVLNSKESWKFNAKLWTNSDQKIKKCDLDQLEVHGFQ